MFNSYGKSLLTAVASVLMLVGGSFSLHAQSQIRGTVYDTDKTQPMAGATVVVEGKNVATITDGSGKFSVNAKEGDVLSVQFMGYKTQNVTVSKSSVYDIILKPDSEQLSEVIVTALGMKREKRSLGYAATEVTGEDLNNVQNSNWLSGMEGKVAGVQFNKASGPIGSTKVVVRGESSLGTATARRFTSWTEFLSHPVLFPMHQVPDIPTRITRSTSVMVHLTSILMILSQLQS